MSIVKYGSNSTITVANIPARDAITPKVNGMVVEVLDPIGDPNAGTGPVTYRYTTTSNSWLLDSTENIESIMHDSGVTAGTYGSSSTIPVITIDAKGVITSAASQALSLSFGDGTSNDQSLVNFNVGSTLPYFYYSNKLFGITGDETIYIKPSASNNGLSFFVNSNGNTYAGAGTMSTTTEAQQFIYRYTSPGSIIGVRGLIQGLNANSNNPYMGAQWDGNFWEGLSLINSSTGITDIRVNNSNCQANFTVVGNGNTPSYQYNYVSNTHTFNGDIILVEDTSPTVVTPLNSGNVKLFGKSIADRGFISQVGSAGLDTALQPLLARNKVGYWNPPGNATTVPGVFAMTAPTVVGTATARNVATTNILTRMRRLGYVSSSSAGNLAGNYTSVAQFTTGTGNNLGGFTYICRFGTSDAATVAGARAFIGLSASVAAPTNVEPSTLVNVIGVAQLSTDATQWYIVYGGSTAQTAIPLGTALGSPNDITTAYEIAIFSPPNQNSVLNYQVTNLNTDVTVTGTFTPTTPGVQTPSSTTLLAHRAWRSNNTTAKAVGLDICSIYIETDQ